MKDNTLSNFELDDIIKSQHLQCRGIFSKDLLPNPLLAGFYIINMQNSNDGDGTHWTAFYYIPNKTSYYFDSFGFPPPQIVESLISPYNFNNKQIQDIKSSACGYFSIGFIKMMQSKGPPESNFKKYINMFSDHCVVNDKIILNIVNANHKN